MTEQNVPHNSDGSSTRPSRSDERGRGRSTPSRRAIVTGMAWSVPVITLATQAPAYAASGGPPTLIFSIACKLPGSSCAPFVKGYILPVRIINLTGRDIRITAVTITSTIETDIAFSQASPALPINVPNGGNVAAYFNASSSNSANLVFTATVTVSWDHGAGDLDVHTPIVQTVTIDGTNPCSRCNPPVPPVPV